MGRALPALLLLALGGCAQQWHATDGVGPRTVAVSDFDGLFDARQGDDPLPFGVRGPAPEGVWRAVTPEHAGTVSHDLPAPEPGPEIAAAPRVPPEGFEDAARAPSLPVPDWRHPPRKRRRAARGQKAAPVERDLDALARERFIANPTLIRARTISFFCPPGRVADVRITGAVVDTTEDGARHASGNARLVLQELTLEADEIILRVAKDANVQILARGEAGLVSRLGKRIVRDEGLSSLIINNDRTIPLR